MNVDTVKIIEEKINKKMAEGEKTLDINLVIALSITGDEPKCLIIDCRGSIVRVLQDNDLRADVTIVTDEDTFMKLLNKKQSPESAFFSGKMKIEGDMGVVVKLGQLFN